jgi:tetratricopeptide (TPR) repeat protein
MRLHAAALLLGAMTTVWAQDDSQRLQVEQRVRLTARLIADSRTAQRIVNSGDREAIGHLDEGRVHQSLAEDLLARGDLTGARKAVDDALRHIGMARRMVPDASARLDAARTRYEQLAPSVGRLLEAWRTRGVGTGDPGLLQAEAEIAAAQQAQQDGRYEDANRRLAVAERHILDGVNAVLHAATLDYTARAGTPAEALALELAQHQSLAELIPIALADLRPAPTAVALIERYQDASRGLRAQALQSRQHGDTAQALAHIRSATLYLQRALAAAGVITPAPTETPP